MGEGVGGCRSTWFFSLPGYYGGDVASWLPTSFVAQAWKASQACRSRSRCLHVLKLQNLSLEQCRQLIKSVFVASNSQSSRQILGSQDFENKVGLIYFTQELGVFSDRHLHIPLLIKSFESVFFKK